MSGLVPDKGDKVRFRGLDGDWVVLSRRKKKKGYIEVTMVNEQVLPGGSITNVYRVKTSWSHRRKVRGAGYWTKGGE